MSILRGIRKSIDTIEIIISDFPSLVKKTKVLPDWPFTIFEDKDIEWLTALNLMEEKTVTTDAYMIHTNPPKLVMTQKVYDAFIQHCKENKSDWIKPLNER